MYLFLRSEKDKVWFNNLLSRVKNFHSQRITWDQFLALFGSGSDNRLMLTQFNHIVSGFHNIPQSWPNQRELCLICGIASEWMDCRGIFGTAPEDRPLFASFFANTDSHHHVGLAVVAISSIVVAATWGCKICTQSNSIYLDCTRITNYPQLSHDPVDYKKRDPRLRQDFKIPKMALSAIVGVRSYCRGPSSMGWSLPSTPDQKPVGGPLG